ncbi:thioredoxin domain-containing protein 17-like [Neocloeon triangulifer]|uniref:thioredoxin domain-containing protein 17-like n=1 Tax=Neocloeon triangulifer TaxID=2078957 RepID=UPI00286FA03A|nr:thioredoxin domain-containing protein 17-like [Neocloeon triangulifer]
MVVHQYVTSLNELEGAVAEINNMSIAVDGQRAPEDQPKPIFVIVSGAKDDNGKSWCPDCVKAEPVLEEAARELAPEFSVFVTVYLGREEWKDKKCVFRTDSRFRLSAIPALLKWPNAEPKLQEEQCANVGALKDFFEEFA